MIRQGLRGNKQSGEEFKTRYQTVRWRSPVCGRMLTVFEAFFGLSTTPKSMITSQQTLDRFWTSDLCRQWHFSEASPASLSVSLAGRRGGR